MKPPRKVAQGNLMKAMVLKEYNRFMDMMEVEKPSIGENDILIRVKACGICHTDLKIFRGEIPPPIVILPHTPGHEVAGEVVEIGDKVTGIQKGDVGILYIYIACRNCEWCLSGHENLCPSLKRVGFELPGGYAQYVRVPAYAFCPFDRNNEWEIKGARLSTKVELLQVIRLVEQGKIKPVISRTFPFEKANEALEALKTEETIGRLVLTF